jgi:hypothetical protein
MLFGELVEGMLFWEFIKVADGWLWHNDMIGNRPERGLDYLGRFVVKIVKGMMESIIGGGAHCMVWLTSLGADCCGGCLESCCIFVFDSRKMRQSFVRWSVSLP